MTEDQIRELFREMREEPLPADSLARVRGAVSRRTEGRRRFWAYAVALAAAAGLLVAVVVVRSRPAPQPHPAPPVVALGPVAAPPPAPEPPPAPRPVRLVRKKRRPPKREVAALIRIETPDPDVVILLVGN